MVAKCSKMHTWFILNAVALRLAFFFFLLSYKCDPLTPVHLREGWASGQWKRPVNWVATGITGTEQPLTAHPHAPRNPRGVLCSWEFEAILCKTQMRWGVRTAELRPRRRGYGRGFLTFNTALSSELRFPCAPVGGTLGFSSLGWASRIRTDQRILLDCQHATSTPSLHHPFMFHAIYCVVYSRFSDISCGSLMV